MFQPKNRPDLKITYYYRNKTGNNYSGYQWDHVRYKTLNLEYAEQLARCNDNENKLKNYIKIFFDEFEICSRSVDQSVEDKNSESNPEKEDSDSNVSESETDTESSSLENIINPDYFTASKQNIENFYYFCLEISSDLSTCFNGSASGQTIPEVVSFITELADFIYNTDLKFKKVVVNAVQLLFLYFHITGDTEPELFDLIFQANQNYTHCISLNNNVQEDKQKFNLMRCLAEFSQHKKTCNQINALLDPLVLV